jgi:hypothetical protein
MSEKEKGEFSFVKGGKLNMVVARSGKSVERVPTDAILSSEATVRSNGMDVVTFLPNVVFKFTLDFRKGLPCVGSAVREMTDWVLCSAMGGSAHYNKVEERLLLHHCMVCIQSNVEGLLSPFHVSLKLIGEEWKVEQVWR